MRIIFMMILLWTVIIKAETADNNVNYYSNPTGCLVMVRSKLNDTVLTVNDKTQKTHIVSYMNDYKSGKISKYCSKGINFVSAKQDKSRLTMACNWNGSWGRYKRAKTVLTFNEKYDLTSFAISKESVTRIFKYNLSKSTISVNCKHLKKIRIIKQQ